LYRYAASDLALGGSQDGYWRAAENAPQDQRWRHLLETSLNAGWRLIEFPAPDVPGDRLADVRAAHLRSGLCFAQQMLAKDRSKPPAVITMYSRQLLREAESDRSAAPGVESRTAAAVQD
jgi:hypothetical protein